jgi:CBS domain-containing protein
MMTSGEMKVEMKEPTPIPSVPSFGIISADSSSIGNRTIKLPSAPHLLFTPGHIAQAQETDDSFYATLAGRLRAGTFAVDSYEPVRPLVTCCAEDKVVDIFRRMIKHNIFAVPVISETNRQWSGFIDMWDITRYVLDHFDTQRLGIEQSFWDLLNQEYKFQDKSVHELMRHPMHTDKQWHHVSSNYSLFTVCEAMVQERARCIPVLQSKQLRNLVNLITQSQVIHWLDHHIELIGAKAAKQLSQCPEMFKSVISVPNSDTAWSAFDLMGRMNISGVAVVNETGQLVENISVRDIKVISSDGSTFWRMQHSILQFTHKLDTDYTHKHQRPRQVVYVTPTATLQEVIHWLVLFHVHRVYIVDNHVDRKPIGVCSVRGVLQQCIYP